MSQKTVECIDTLESLDAQGGNLPDEEAISLLSQLQQEHPKLRFYYDKLFRLVVVGPPDCQVTMPYYLYARAGIIIAAHSGYCELVKDEDDVVRTEGLKNRLMQSALGLSPTGRLDEETLSALAEVVAAQPKMAEEEIEKVLNQRRKRFS